MNKTIPAVSLVGFMNQGEAAAYLARCSVVQNRTEPALTAVWQDARAALGRLAPYPGAPGMRSLGPDHRRHLRRVEALPRFRETFGPHASFQLIEIDPLLVYQFHVEVPRASTHCGDANAPVPDLEELLKTCLPDEAEKITSTIRLESSGLLVQSRSHNLRVHRFGNFGTSGTHELTGLDFAGVFYGAAMPVVQVVAFRGRAYLTNGLHRVFGFKRRGATHVPCVFRTVTDAADITDFGAGEVFALALLESTYPPMCAYFDARAYPMEVRERTKYLRINFNEVFAYDPLE